MIELKLGEKKSTELKSINLKYFSIQYIFRRKFSFKIWIIIFDTRTMLHVSNVEPDFHPANPINCDPSIYRMEEKCEIIKLKGNLMPIWST